MAEPRRWFARVEWKPQDCWVGIFWRQEGDTEFNLWVCLFPMLPLHIGWTTWVDPPATEECPDESTCSYCNKPIVWAGYGYIHPHSGEADCRPLSASTQGKPVEWAGADK